MAATHESLRYVRGVTSVHTSADEAYSDGAGVCQDFAHLALALTKSVGLPSRYVSGYFHPEADAAIGEEITGESHAWVEVWTGRWWAYDPTNDCPVGERHVAVGPRARLRRRPTGQGHLRRQRREHHAGGRAHGEGQLSRVGGCRADQDAHLAARRSGRPGRRGGGDRGGGGQRRRARGARARGRSGDRRARRGAARRPRSGRRRLPRRAQRPGVGRRRGHRAGDGGARTGRTPSWPPPRGSCRPPRRRRR